MFCDRALAGHQTLGNRATVEQDDFILIVAVIVVPVQNRSAALGGKGHGTHGNGRAHIDLAGGHDAPIIQLTQQHTGTDPQIGLHFVPAPQGKRIQMVFRNVLI